MLQVFESYQFSDTIHESHLSVTQLGVICLYNPKDKKNVTRDGERIQQEKILHGFISTQSMRQMAYIPTAGQRHVQR